MSISDLLKSAQGLEGGQAPVASSGAGVSATPSRGIARLLAESQQYESTIPAVPVEQAPAPVSQGGQIANFLLPSTTQTIKDLGIDPLNLKAKPRNALKDAWEVVKGSWDKAATSVMDQPKTRTGRLINTIQTTADIGGAIFSPISALFTAANDIPVIGSVSKAVTLPFALLGDAGKDLGMGFVESLPISEETKKQLTPAVEELFSLAAQIYGGGKMGDVPGLKATKEKLTAKYGAKDAEVLVNKAQEMAKQKAEHVKTEAAAPTPESIKDIAEQMKTPVENNKSLYNPANKEMDNRFMSSKGQTPLEGVEGNFEIGDWGKRHGQDSVGKIDRFPESEIPEVLNSSILKIPSSDNPALFRSGNTANIAKVGDEFRVVYTRPNISGVEEVIAWHKISKPIDTYLENIGASAGIRTRIASFEDLKPNPLADRGKSIVSGETLESQVPSTRGEKLIQAAIEKKLIDAMDTESPMHTPEKMKDWAEKAVDHINKNPDNYMDIATGKKDAPEGIRAEAIYTAAEIKALREGDTAKIIELAKSKVPTEAGRGLKALDSTDPNSPVKIVRDIMKAREEAAKKNLPKSQSTAKAKEEIVKKGKAEVKTTRMKIADAQSLLNSLIC